MISSGKHMQHMSKTTGNQVVFPPSLLITSPILTNKYSTHPANLNMMTSDTRKGTQRKHSSFGKSAIFPHGKMNTAYIFELPKRYIPKRNLMPKRLELPTKFNGKNGLLDKWYWYEDKSLSCIPYKLLISLDVNTETSDLLGEADQISENLD